MGKSRPFQVTACVIGRDANCATASPSTATYHRVQVTFNGPPFGGFTSYELQRRRVSAPTSAFTTITPTLTLTTFTDLTELPHNHQYVYRVRGLAADGNSEWSVPSAPVTITNDAPVAAGEGTFSFPYKQTLSLSVPMLLSNDSDTDSPTVYLARALQVTQQPTNGTVTATTVQGVLTLVYQPNKNYIGPDSFNNRSNDGLSSDAPQVQLSNPSNEVTVTVFAEK